MFSIIAFIIGVIVLLRNSAFRAGTREVSKQQARAIGFLLVAPFVLEFCATTVLVSGAWQIDDEGQLTLDSASLQQTINTVAVLEFILLAAAIGGSLYIIYGGGLPTGTGNGGTPFAPPPPSAPMRSVPEIMTVAEAAAYLRVTEADVLSMIENGKLPAARISGSYRIARSAIDDMLSASSTESPTL